MTRAALGRFAIVAAVTALLVGTLIQPGSADTGDFGSLGGAITYAGVAPAQDTVTVRLKRLVAGTWTSAGSGAYFGSHWHIGSLRAGTYQVYFTSNATDSAGHSRFAAEYYQNAVAPGSSTTVTIGDDEQVDDIDVAFDNPGTISGTVTDDAGTPLPDATAWLYQRKSSGAWFALSSTPISDADGHFTFGLLPPGDYTMSVNSYGFRTKYFDNATTLADAAVIHVNSGQAVTGTDFALSAADSLGTVSGTVTDFNGSAVGGATVSLIQGADGTPASSPRTTTSSVDGTYSFAALEGTYRLGARPKVGTDLAAEYYANAASLADAEPFVVSSGAATDIDVELAAGERISGHVTDADGGPVVGAVVSALRPKNSSWVQAATTATDASGNYTLTGLAAEPNIVEVTDPAKVLDSRFSGDVPELEDAVPVTPASGATTTRDFVLPPRGHFAGTVRDDLGNPLPNVSVAAIRVASTGTLINYANATTGTDGTYTLPPTASGTRWLIWFDDGTGPFGAEYFDDALGVADAAKQTLTSGNVTVVDGTLELERANARYDKPTVSGATAVGVTLSVNNGTWEPAGVTFTYQWLRDGVVIPSQTHSTYRLAFADLGTRISARVTGSEAGYTSTTYTATTDDPVRLGRFYGAYVSLDDTFRYWTVYGDILSANGAKDLYPTADVTYQWFRDDALIPGATARTYRAELADLGHHLRAEGTWSAPGHHDVTRSTASSYEVMKAYSTTKIVAGSLSGHRVRITAYVTVPNIPRSRLDGEIWVKYRGTGSTLTMRKLRIKDGQLTVVLPHQVGGYHSYWAQFRGVPGSVNNSLRSPSKYAHVH